MHLKTVKLNCLTLGELQNEPISKKKKKKWSIPLKCKNLKNRKNMRFSIK